MSIPNLRLEGLEWIVTIQNENKKFRKIGGIEPSSVIYLVPSIYSSFHSTFHSNHQVRSQCLTKNYFNFYLSVCRGVVLPQLVRLVSDFYFNTFKEHRLIRVISQSSIILHSKYTKKIRYIQAFYQLFCNFFAFSSWFSIHNTREYTKRSNPKKQNASKGYSKRSKKPRKKNLIAGGIAKTTPNRRVVHRPYTQYFRNLFISLIITLLIYEIISTFPNIFSTFFGLFYSQLFTPTHYHPKDTKNLRHFQIKSVTICQNAQKSYQHEVWSYQHDILSYIPRSGISRSKNGVLG